MAKKKKNENTLSYLQMPLPSGGKYSKMTKVAFGGLNKRYTHDSGELSMEKNISTKEYPYLVPSEQKIEYLRDYTNPISMFAFDDFLLVIYRQNDAIKIDYIVETRDPVFSEWTTNVFTSTLKSSGATSADDVPRSIVQFNVYDTPTDPVAGKYVKKLLIFPDKKSMYFDRDDLLSDENNKDGNDFTVYSLDDDVIVKEYKNDTPEVDESGAIIYPPPDTASHNYYYQHATTKKIYKWVDDASDSKNSGWTETVMPTMPDIKYATVHLSRLFGVSDDRVYASGFNDYANWNLDTIDEYNESNSWCSSSQSNTKAGGDFTGITTFQNHVICFKRDFMHEIYNTKNPFRIQDIYAEGAIDNRSIQDVDGKLIFVSDDDVKIYTGSNPRIIGHKLNMSQYTYAVSGTDNRNYYLYCEDARANKYLYVYDTYTDMWSEQSVENKVLSFAHNKTGMYMLCSNGVVYQMDTGGYAHKWSFETDLITNKTVDIKHIKKLQMLVDIPEQPPVRGIGRPLIPANMQVYILYDNEVFDDMTSEEQAKRLVYTSLLPIRGMIAYHELPSRQGKFPIRVKPRKTANYGFKLHIEGEGYVKLYELEIFVEQGGDLYV